MVLDTKIRNLKNHFGIVAPEDWQSVEPAWILAQDGIGPVTLDHLRIYLSARGLTLKGDRTPEYWQANLSAAKIGHTLGNEDFEDEELDRGLMIPFTVYVDTAEQQPFTFQGLRADASQGGRPLIVPTERHALGRHPDSLGDYSLSSGVGRCHVERKSMDDAHGTILGWGGRRERFEAELENLARMEAGLIVVECSLADLIKCAPDRKNSAAVNAKILHRSIIAFQQDYHVAWQFCESPRMAEIHTYRWLERFDRKQREQLKAGEREYSRQGQQVQAIEQANKAADRAAEVERQVAAL